MDKFPKSFHYENELVKRRYSAKGYRRLTSQFSLSHMSHTNYVGELEYERSK